MCKCITFGMWQYRIFSLRLEKAIHMTKFLVVKELLTHPNQAFCIRLGNNHLRMTKNWRFDPYSKKNKSWKMKYILWKVLWGYKLLLMTILRRGQTSKASGQLTRLQEVWGRGFSQRWQNLAVTQWQLTAELVVGGGAGGQERIGRDGWDKEHKNDRHFVAKSFFLHRYSCVFT